MIRNAVILAGGKATRLQKNKEVFVSKAMYNVNGKPLISNAFEVINQISTIKKIFILYNPDDKDILSCSYFTNKQIIFIPDKKQKGSLYTFWLCRKKCHKSFIMFDCDTIFSAQEFLYMNEFKLKDDNDYIICVKEPTKEQKPNALVVKNNITKFCKKGVVGGVHVGYIYKFCKFPTKICGKFLKNKEYHFSKFFECLIEIKKIRTMEISKLIDIDSEEDVINNSLLIQKIIK